MNDLETLTNLINSPVFKGLSEMSQKELVEQQRSKVHSLIESAFNEHIKPILDKYNVGYDVSIVVKSGAKDDNDESTSIDISGFDYHSKRVNKMVLEIFRRLSSKGELDKLMPYITQIAERPNRSIKVSEVELANILLLSSFDDVKRRNVENHRWYETPFTISGNIYYLSTQWRNDGKKGLQFGNFKLLLDKLYPHMFEIKEEGNELYLKEL